MLHGNSDYATFSVFCSHLSSLFVDNDVVRLTIGCDDEFAMKKAIKAAFPLSNHITCVQHFKQNVTHYLDKNLFINANQKSSIKSALFGKGGLTETDDPDIFLAKVESFRLLQGSLYPEFMKYFESRIIPMIRSNVLIGRGAWTNNN